MIFQAILLIQVTPIQVTPIQVILVAVVTAVIDIFLKNYIHFSMIFN